MSDAMDVAAEIAGRVDRSRELSASDAISMSPPRLARQIVKSGLDDENDGAVCVVVDSNGLGWIVAVAPMFGRRFDSAQGSLIRVAHTAPPCPVCGAEGTDVCVSRPSGRPYGCDHAARRR